MTKTLDEIRTKIRNREYANPARARQAVKRCAFQAGKKELTDLIEQWEKSPAPKRKANNATPADARPQTALERLEKRRTRITQEIEASQAELATVERELAAEKVREELLRNPERVMHALELLTQTEAARALKEARECRHAECGDLCRYETQSRVSAVKERIAELVEDVTHEPPLA